MREKKQEFIWIFYFAEKTHVRLERVVLLITKMVID